MQLAMPPLLLVNYICNCFVIILHLICESDEGGGGWQVVSPKELRIDRAALTPLPPPV
jgi:hypothetical protein